MVKQCQRCHGTEKLMISRSLKSGKIYYICRVCNKDRPSYKHIPRAKKTLIKKIKKIRKAMTLEDRRAYTKKWKEENPEYMKSYMAIYNPLKKEEKKVQNRKRLYGLTQDQHKELLIKQNSNCAICGVNQSLLKRELCVDHDHQTGKVRGLLCTLCNTGLGCFRDDILLIKKVPKYLEPYEN